MSVKSAKAGAGAAESREGGCWCGAVRYRISGALGPVVFCHCSQCVRTHGHAAAFASGPRAGFVLLREDGLRWHRCSSMAERAFCSRCGSRLFWKAEGESDVIEIAVGSLDDTDGLVREGHIYVADKPPYYEIGDGLPQRPQR